MLRADTYLNKINHLLYKNAKSTIKELELKAKNRGIEVYKSVSKDKLLSIFDS